MSQFDRLVGTEPVPTGAHSQQFLHGITELVGRPLRIVGTALVDVAHGDTLNVGFLKEMQHDAQTLRPDADESDVDFVAGRNESSAAQHSSRNDGESERGGRSLRDEVAARYRAERIASQITRILHDPSCARTSTPKFYCDVGRSACHSHTVR